MATARNKRIGGWVRGALCAAALWWVCQSLALEDRVHPADGRQAITGTVVERPSIDAAAVTILRSDGMRETIAVANVARDAQGGLRSTWRNTSKPMLCLSLGIFLVVPLLQGVRFVMMLSAQGIRLRTWESVKLAFAGNFLNFAAPFGSTAGDVFKAYYAAMHTTRKTEAATTVFLDRAVGLGTLVGTVGLIVLISPAGSRLAPFRPYFLGIGLMGATAAVAYLSPLVRGRGFVRRTAARLPRVEQLRRIDDTARRLLRRPGVVAGSVALTVLLQLFAAGSFVAVCVALGMSVVASDMTDVYAYFSTGEVVKAIPGPPQGLGTVELAYGYFFAGMGSAAQIVAAAFAFRLVNLLCAVPGLLITMTGSYAPRLKGAGETVADRSPMAMKLA